MKLCEHCGDYITGERAKKPNVLFCSDKCSHTHKKQKRAKKPPRPPWMRSRFEILARDNFTCQYCGRTATEIELQIDHIHPKSKGGDNDQNNLITACIECNQGKGDILLSQQLIKRLQNK